MSPARVRTPLLAGLLAGVALVAVAAPAVAHDQLVASTPAAGAVLAEPPTEVVLEFNAEVLDISTTVLLDGPSGRVETGPAEVAGTVVTVPVTGTTAPGPHTVTWRVVSTDGHPIQGVVEFTLTGPGPTPSTEPSAPTAEPTPVVTAPEPDPPASSATTDGTWPGAAYLIATALAAALAIALLRRRRPRTPPGDPT